MPLDRCISLICALVIAGCAGGWVIAQERTPVPEPPAVERPLVLAQPPGGPDIRRLWGWDQM